MRSSGIAVSGIIACAILLASCSYTPLLRSKEYLLHTQTIKGNKAIPKDELVPLYQQLPNRRFAALGTKTYLHLYLIGRLYLDTQKIDQQIIKTHKKYLPLLEEAAPDTLKVQQLQRSHALTLAALYEKKKISADTAAVHEEIKATNAKYEQEISQTLADTLKRAEIRKKYNAKLKKLERTRTEGNYMMRVMGEPPSLFDTNTVNQTKDQFINYYATKGYLHTDVSYVADTSGKNVTVTYNINENPPLIIKDIVYEIQDSSVKAVFKADSHHTFIKRGMVYNEEVFNNERERTFKLLRDNGFYYFAKNYIFIDVDTSGHKHEATLYYIIRNPDQGAHKKYVIKEVVMNIDKGKFNSKGVYTYNYNNKLFNMYYKKYSRKILNSKIPIEKGAYFSARQTQRTQNRLSQLQMFKFVNIAYTNVNDSLIATINTASLPKYQISDEFGVNTNVNRQIPGPYGSITFSNRNTFRGCE
ncbi:MAG TPA: POTRA domain-containing protein, partial [Cytophagales bacterium]|nr:POTRA domain-containing protein [Cytophagales bacterium]